MSIAIRLGAALALGLGLAATVSAHDGDPKLLDKQPMHPGPGWRNAQRLAAAGPGAGGAQALLGPGVQFPASGVTLLAWLSLTDFNQPANGNGNSCFGYVAPSGREYAIMGLYTGTAFVEITQPGNPVIVEHIPGPQSLWRDMKVFGQHCYAISEGGGGIQVMDLSQIDSGVVTLVNTVNDDAQSATHTLALNTQTGYLYRSGGSGQGLRIYDLNPNPASPQRVGTWSSRYVHEPSVFTVPSGPNAGKEIAFCCGGLNGGFNSTGLYVVDVTNKASPQQLQFLAYANAEYAHQCWPSPDFQYLYLNDELDDSNLGITSQTRVFQIHSNTVPLSVSFVGTFTNGNSSVDHNLYTKGDLIFESNYRSGLRIYQTSAPGTPTSPVEIAYFDTWPQDDNASFNGLWNNYPYFPSGVVIGSDIEKGLFVWWVGDPLVQFDVVGGDPAGVSPAGEALRVQVGGSPQAGTLRVHVDSGSGFQTSDLAPNGQGEWLALLPPAPCGTQVRYYFSGQSANGIVWFDPPGAPDATHTAVANFGALALASEEFEGAATGWQGGLAGDTASTGQWTLVDPNGTSAQPEDDHTGAGTRCWVTGQGTAGGAVGNADVDNGFTTLRSPAFDLSTRPNARIAYWRWYVNDGNATVDDQFVVDVSNNDGTTWTNVETLGPTGPETSGGWFQHEFRVADFVAVTSQVRVRFIAADIGGGSIVEAAIDDFRIDDVACTGYEAFCFGDGSGAACPCGNHGAAGRGCANSTGQGGLLAGSGTADVASDTLVLSGSGMPASASAIYLQGSAHDGGGLGTVLYDGLRCVNGTIVRLGTKQNAGGASQFPDAGDPTVSVRGGVVAGQTRYYQAFYRNAAAFCTSDTANWTNGVAVVW